MNNLRQELTAILTDPQRTGLYSHAQLMAMLVQRGVPLPEDRQEAWDLVMREREEIEREVRQ